MCVKSFLLYYQHLSSLRQAFSIIERRMRCCVLTISQIKMPQGYWEGELTTNLKRSLPSIKIMKRLPAKHGHAQIRAEPHKILVERNRIDMVIQ